MKNNKGRRYKGNIGKETQTMAKENSENQSHWTFLTNHTHVLALLYANPDIILREVAVEVGITERAVQRIIFDLEEGGFIKREKMGAGKRRRKATRKHQ